MPHSWHSHVRLRETKYLWQVSLRVQLSAHWGGVTVNHCISLQLIAVTIWHHRCEWTQQSVCMIELYPEDSSAVWRSLPSAADPEWRRYISASTDLLDSVTSTSVTLVPHLPSPGEKLCVRLINGCQRAAFTHFTYLMFHSWHYLGSKFTFLGASKLTTVTGTHFFKAKLL